MKDRRLTDTELEGALRDLGAHLAYPRAVDLLPAVRARVERGRSESFWALLRSPRAAFAPALATLALLLIAALVFQPVAATAAEALGLRGLAIFRIFEPPAPAFGKVLADALRVTSVDEAARQAGFTVVVPGALGRPDDVYVRASSQGATVFLVYGARPGIAPSAQTGIAVLVTEARGSFEAPLLGKLVGPGSRVEQLSVNGGPGVWIEGAPHQIFFRSPDGQVVIDSLRLAGNVLAWDQGGLFIRLEADLAKDQVLRIASSAR